MRLIEISGTGYERGKQHGEALASEIADFIKTIMNVCEANIPYAVTREELTAFTRKNFEHTRNFAPELADELLGIANGAGQSIDDIMLLNSILELEDIRVEKLGLCLLRRPTKEPLKSHLKGQLESTTRSAGENLENLEDSESSRNPEKLDKDDGLTAGIKGCTTFNVTPQQSCNQHAIIGQTFDMEEYYSKYNVLIKINYGGGKTALVYSFAGVLGLNGMNSAGIGVCINKLVATDAQPGVIYPALIRMALEQDRVGDSFGAIVFAKRACGMNYQIASADNIAWCAEVSARDFDLIDVNKALAHSNHYTSPRMRAYETAGWLSHGGSYVRYQTANRRLKDSCGEITVELLMQLTKDHTNYPRCICAHGFESQSEYTAFTTVAATLYDLTEQVAYVCDGQPCKNKYQVYKL